MVTYHTMTVAFSFVAVVDDDVSLGTRLAAPPPPREKHDLKEFNSKRSRFPFGTYIKTMMDTCQLNYNPVFEMTLTCL